MRNFISLLKYAPKRTFAVLAMIAAAIIIPATLLAWGPDRPTYTIEVPADHVTFNSITNNPSHGDERNFVQVRDAASGNETYVDSISLTAGHEYVIYVYYHNNAASNLNASGVGIAHGAYVKAQVPAIVSNGSTGTKAVGYVGASNATPAEVWDDISFSNTTGGDIALRYIPGSATIHSFGAVNGQAMGDSIVTTGTPLGYDSLNGELKGCNEYAGYVTFRVKADQPNFTVTKQVRKAGETTWVESVASKPGETVEYLVTYKNTGTTQQNDVVINDILPKGVSYVAGTTVLKNTTNPNGLTVSDNITKGGINIGNYASGAAAYVKFSGKIDSNDSLPTCGANTLQNIAKAQTNNGTKQDTADVTVNKDCPPVVSYTCNVLGIKDLSKTSKQFTIDYTVQNATFKSVTYVIRNDKNEIVDTKISTSKIFVYNQTKTGKYTVEATITVTANGKDYTATSNGCKGNFEVTDNPVVSYTCNTLSAKKLSRTSTEFSVDYTVNNATFKNVSFVIRDGDNKVIDTKTSTTNVLNYENSKVGKYTVDATITAIANGKEVTATSDGCKGNFEIPSVPENPETPELPVTGMTDNIITFFGIGSLVTSLGYYISSRRSLLGR